MRRFALALGAAAALVATAGCDTFEKLGDEVVDVFRDRIVHQSPKMYSPLPTNAVVYLERPLGAASVGLYARNGYALMNVFKRAFERHGVKVVCAEEVVGKDFQSECKEAERRGCDWIFFITIDRWEYGDAGFSGAGDRDDVYFTVMLAKAGLKRVADRASIEVKNGFGRSKSGGGDSEELAAPVVDRYVDFLFNPD